jgi:hypothetical protein
MKKSYFRSIKLDQRGNEVRGINMKNEEREGGRRPNCSWALQTDEDHWLLDNSS